MNGIQSVKGLPSAVAWTRGPSPSPKFLRQTALNFKFGKLIFSNIIKSVAAISRILKLKCTKFNFSDLGSTRNPAGGSQQHSSKLSSWILRILLLRGGREGEMNFGQILQSGA